MFQIPFDRPSPQTIQFLVSFTALFVSATALFVAVLNYKRKSGVKIRGDFTTARSKYCDDEFVANIILENLKDRTVTIFAIYLRVGINNYIEIENFDGKPLLLKAYESYQNGYGPIEFYGFNFKKVNFNDLLGNSKIKKQLILSTAEGKYVVPSNIPNWSPVSEYFRNYWTVVAQPIQTIHKGRYVGANIKYVIELVGENGEEEIIPIHPEDFKVRKFRDFDLTVEALESKKALEAFLQNQIDMGVIGCKGFKVYDLSTLRDDLNKRFSSEYIRAKDRRPFLYHVIGRTVTRYHYWKQQKKNRELKKRASEQTAEKVKLEEEKSESQS